MEKDKKTEVHETKKLKKFDYKPLAIEVAKAIGYSFLTGVCMAAGGHAYASVMKSSKGKLISINGGKQSAAM